MHKSLLFIGLIGIVLVTFSLGSGNLPTSAQSAGMTQRVSIASDGTPANKESYNQSISADGRYVAFISSATNLIPNDTNNATDIFVHDRQSGETTRVSVASGGTQANSSSLGYRSPSISADGRFVAFVSAATNLVQNDTNQLNDIFVHDRQDDKTLRASVSTEGTQGNAHSYELSISGNGRYVTFVSDSSNLVPDDTNDAPDIFVHDIQTGQTTRISVASGSIQGNDFSGKPSISSNGRYIAFRSGATNLVTNDTNGFIDIFVHDRESGETIRVSVASDGTQGNITSSLPSDLLPKN